MAQQALLYTDAANFMSANQKQGVFSDNILLELPVLQTQSDWIPAAGSQMDIHHEPRTELTKGKNLLSKHIKAERMKRVERDLTGILQTTFIEKSEKRPNMPFFILVLHSE